MTDLKPNAELAYNVLDTALAHPEHLYMSVWASSPDGRAVSLKDLTASANCGTVACFAGWTAALLGHQVDASGHLYRDGELVTADLQSFAARELGLTEDAAETLFHDTGEDELPSAVEALFGPRPAGGA